jgi:pseudouridine-5'-phosphate glycosidase
VSQGRSRSTGRSPCHPRALAPRSTSQGKWPEPLLEGALSSHWNRPFSLTAFRVRAISKLLWKPRNTSAVKGSFLAHRAGIKVFSTGGLGGVHHGAATSFDESADMTTLARTPIVVVSAGVKSILDVAATLERFETLNIPVVGYKTTKYPGFYVSDSGFAIEYTVNTPDEVTAICRARDDLHIASAILLANPIAEDKQFPPAELDDILSRAWAQAEKNGINGKATTPFLLDFIQRETNGRSVNVNVDVYRSNVSLGGEVAIALTH